MSCQKRSDWQINPFVAWPQLCFFSVGVRGLQTSRKTKSTLTFEHIMKTAPVLPIRAGGWGEDKNLQAERDLEKPFWEGFISAKKHWQLPPSLLKCWAIKGFSLPAAGFLLQTLGLMPLSEPEVTTPVFHWGFACSARVFCTKPGFSVTFTAVPG